MTKLFEYGKVVFTKPNLQNVDDMVEMMNDESISSMLSTKKNYYKRYGNRMDQ